MSSFLRENKIKRLPSLKKGSKCPVDFFLIEFQGKNSTERMRFKVIEYPALVHSIHIREKGSCLSKNSQVAENRVEIHRYISEKKLMEAMRRYISERFKASADSITFRWENGSLKMSSEASVQT